MSTIYRGRLRLFITRVGFLFAAILVILLVFTGLFLSGACRETYVACGIGCVVLSALTAYWQHSAYRRARLIEEAERRRVKPLVLLSFEFQKELRKARYLLDMNYLDLEGAGAKNIDESDAFWYREEVQSFIHLRDRYNRVIEDLRNIFQEDDPYRRLLPKSYVFEPKKLPV